MCALRSCSWPVATFGQTTAWAGKTILVVDERFVLEGHGVISAEDVMQYDRAGHLVWSSDGMRAWVGAKAEAPPGPVPSEAPQRMASASLSLRRVLVAVVVAVAVLLAVAAYSNRQEGASSSASPRVAAGSSAAPATATSAAATTWASRFEGTWVSTKGGAEEIVFSRSADTATIHISSDPGDWTETTFQGDAMVLSLSGHADRIVYRCAASSPGTFVGLYRVTVSPEQAAGDPTCTVSFAGAVLTLRFEQPGMALGWLTFTLWADGQTLTVGSAGDGSSDTDVLRRQ